MQYEIYENGLSLRVSFDCGAGRWKKNPRFEHLIFHKSFKYIICVMFFLLCLKGISGMRGEKGEKGGIGNPVSKAYL